MSEVPLQQHPPPEKRGEEVSDESTAKVPREPAPEKGPVRVDFEFRRELAEKVEGNLAKPPYACEYGIVSRPDLFDQYFEIWKEPMKVIPKNQPCCNTYNDK